MRLFWQIRSLSAHLRDRAHPFSAISSTGRQSSRLKYLTCCLYGQSPQHLMLTQSVAFPLQNETQPTNQPNNDWGDLLLARVKRLPLQTPSVAPLQASHCNTMIESPYNRTVRWLVPPFHSCFCGPCLLKRSHRLDHDSAFPRRSYTSSTLPFLIFCDIWINLLRFLGGVPQVPPFEILVKLRT